MAVYNQSNSLNVGDIIKMGDQEIEIACVTSEGIGNVSDAATVVCSEETFARLTGDNGFITMGVILKKMYLMLQYRKFMIWQMDI